MQDFVRQDGNLELNSLQQVQPVGMIQISSMSLCYVNYCNNIFCCISVILADRTVLHGARIHWHHTVVCLHVCLSVTLCIAAKRYILQQMSEQVNRKCPHAYHILTLRSRVYEKESIWLKNTPVGVWYGIKVSPIPSGVCSGMPPSHKIMSFEFSIKMCILARCKSKL